MKYKVFELYVVKDVDNNECYFICKKNGSNTYVDIFSNKKIVQNEEFVEPLSKYFSTFETINFTTGKVLTLDKKTLLSKLISINSFLKFNQTNEFGDKNYKMKDSYHADDLVVANLKRVSNQVTYASTPMQETTEQKYIFEVVYLENEIRYREIFTGFLAKDKVEYFELPYVEDYQPFTDFIPEAKGSEIPKLSLIWALNDINYSNDKANKKLLKRD